MIILPSPSAFDNEDTEYFDDYYIDVFLSCVEGKLYTSAPTKEQVAPKEAIATVHLKVKSMQNRIAQI